MFPKNKQSKLRQTKKDEVKEKVQFKLCNRDKICFLFPCLFIFHHINIHKKHT